MCTICSNLKSFDLCHIVYNMENKDKVVLGVESPKSDNLPPLKEDNNNKKVAVGVVSPNSKGPPSLKKPVRKRQGALSIQSKLALLNAVDKGEKRKTDIAFEYGIPSSTLSTILKQREKIIAACQEVNLNRKRLRLPRFVDVDKALSEWCRSTQDQGVKLSGPMVHQKAKEIAAGFNYPQFNCSNGWVSRFKQRHGISFSRIPERNIFGISFLRTPERMDLLQQIQTINNEDPAKENPANTKLANENHSTTSLAEVLPNFKPCDVYCVLSFPLFWSALPPHAFPKIETKLKDHNQEHVTVILASNMDGSKKLPLRVVIDKTGQSLSCLMDVRSKCPVQYTYNEGAVLTPDIFVQWIQHVDSSFDMENRKVCFLVEQNEMFPQVKGLNAVQLLHLPKENCHSHLQSVPMYLKIAYRLKLVELLSTSQTLSMNLTDALNVLHQQWKALPIGIIKQAFVEASNVAFSTVEVPLDNIGCLSEHGGLSEQTDLDSVMSTAQSRLIEKIKSEVNLTPSVKKACLNLGIGCFGTLDQLMGKTNLVNSQSVLDKEAPPTMRQANEALDTLKRFFDSRCISNASIAGHVKESMGVIENSIKVMSD